MPTFYYLKQKPHFFAVGRKERSGTKDPLLMIIFDLFHCPKCCKCCTANLKYKRTPAWDFCKLKQCSESRHDPDDFFRTAHNRKHLENGSGWLTELGGCHV